MGRACGPLSPPTIAQSIPFRSTGPTGPISGSNDTNFGAGNVEMLGELSLGDGASRDGVNMLTSPIGRYEILIASEQASQKYQYLKLRNQVTGSISYLAFLAVLPEP